jgi:heat shock protein HslJ
MFSKKIASVFSFLVGLIIISACVPVEPAFPDSNALSDTMWNLTGFSTSDSFTPLVLKTAITLDLSEERVSGTAGCNHYGSGYTLNGNAIQFSPEGFESTLMYCDPPEIMDQETRYLSWLQKAETTLLEGDQLTIQTTEGVLIFEKAQHVALEGTDWQLNGIVEGDAVVSTFVDEKINIQFENGIVNGSAGCNQYFADYMLDGENLSLGVIGATTMACEGETGQREATFLAALAQTVGYRIERNTLTLLDANGNPLMNFSVGQ